ncbi:MAG: ABC transporter ATP-binding protein [Actinobacteria bacterium]|nr:MAG: ABC transporter ATP-binding protein [Actinomycetota bacterium]
MDPLHFSLDIPLREFALDVELTVGREVVALVGPSGAGKTTLLRAIAGLQPALGRISVEGDDWLDSARGIDLPAEQRSVGLVFQEYALFPHLTVRKNVEFGRKGGAALLERFGLATLADAKPRELSGGERQRVALARALAPDPAVLLLDEPLSALDAHTRGEVRAELQQLLREADRPTLVVTHDFEDAATLATQVGVVVQGRLRQLGTPAELVASPADPFVASLTGANVLRGRARRAQELTELELPTGELIRSTDPAEGDAVAIVYPWEVTLSRTSPDDSAQNHIAGVVASLVPVGNRVRARVGPLTAEITTDSSERLGLQVGGTAVASFKATATRLLPEAR